MGRRHLLLCLPFIAACAVDAGPSPAAGAGAAPAAWFVDRTHDARLDFVHINGMAGRFHLPEIMGPGAALLDYDNDGDLDVFFVQGAGGGPGDPALIRGDRLYRSDLSSGQSPTPTFTDVTDRSGIASTGYGMGVAAGDIDNDGCVDLYITRFGANQMFRNRCDGTFADVSAASRTGRQGWSVSASFLDFDRDGWLDLFVVEYVSYGVDRATDCFTRAGKPDYCSPSVYRPRPATLYRNERNGTFTDVGSRSGISREPAPGLGAVTADFDGDGWIDIYVANDGEENHLWMNRRDGTFENRALVAGAALSIDGKAQGSMGVDAGDFDADGDEDLVVTNLTGEGTTVYANDGSATFVDASRQSAVRVPSLPFTGFGAAWLDFDNDGRLDILAVNGAVRVLDELEQAKDLFPFHQRKQLFRNTGDGRFEDVTALAGGVFERSDVGRGAAFGDIDNDGDTDVIVANNNSRPTLLLNTSPARRWLGLKLVGRDGRRDMLGARVAIIRRGQPPLWRRAHTDGSYASSSDPRVLAGLGDDAGVDAVRVIWPGGRSEEWRSVALDRYTTFREGDGR